MNSGLLTGAHTNGLSVLYVAYGIGLGILQDDQRNLQIPPGLLRQLLVLGYDIGNQRIINGQFLPSLFKGYAVNLLMLQGSRHKLRIDLDHVVISFFLLCQDIKSLLGISRSDHAIGNLSLDQHGGIPVAHIRQRDKIPKGRHPVCPPGSGIGTGQRRKVLPVHVIHPIDFCQRLCQRKSHGGACRRYMFKGGSRRKSGSLFQVPYKLPAIKGVQKVDISRLS